MIDEHLAYLKNTILPLFAQPGVEELLAFSIFVAGAVFGTIGWFASRFWPRKTKVDAESLQEATSDIPRVSYAEISSAKHPINTHGKVILRKVLVYGIPGCGDMIVTSDPSDLSPTGHWLEGESSNSLITPKLDP